jgi:hypothetical protein
MRNIDEETITEAVLEAMASCENARLQTVMTSLVKSARVCPRNRADRDGMDAGNRVLDQGGSDNK